jgi:hypothetical protein
MKKVSKVAAVTITAVVTLCVVMLAVVSIPAAVMNQNNWTYNTICFGSWICAFPCFYLLGKAIDMKTTTIAVNHTVVAELSFEERFNRANQDVIMYALEKGFNVHHIDNNGYIICVDRDGFYVNENTIKMLMDMEDKNNDK